MSIILEAALFGVILSADSFSAAVAMGFKSFTSKQALLFSLSSGIAEGLTTLLGLWAGTFIVSHYGAFDHWIAFAMLLGVALHMLIEGLRSFRNPERAESAKPFHNSFKIILVSLVTSLDALGVGIGLGVSQKPVLPFVIAVGLSASLATILGLRLAKQLSQSFGPSVSIIGSMVLLYMSFQLLKI